MVADLDMSLEVVAVPTVREADGLAMSSRNILLDNEQRALAPLIFKVLLEAKARMKKTKPEAIIATALEKLNASGLTPEYFEIVDGDTLQPVPDFNKADFVVACTAVKLGKVRLIDNMVFKGAPNLPFHGHLATA